MAKKTQKTIKKTTRKKRKVRTPSDPKVLAQRKAQRKLSREFKVFTNTLGFTSIPCDGIEINFGSRTGELDHFFVYENLIILAELTVGKPDSSHILKKQPLYRNIANDIPGFLAMSRDKYPSLKPALNALYDDDQYQLRILYVSLYDASEETITASSGVLFLQGSLRKYFYALAKTIQRSARVEFFNYLSLDWRDIGNAAIQARSQTNSFAGQLLPESMSSFPTGYRVVSFYADPESLIASAYVLRRDGWRDDSHLYQRILVRNKINKMRHYLIDQKRVFVNNIIVTLPSNTAINELEAQGTNIAAKDLNKARSITISIPSGYSIIGIVDGQHRIFCYHEGSDTLDAKIAQLRRKQHLLVTGIIYPDNIKEKTRLEFEAKLFLEINDTQTRAQPSLRQDIETIVRPFSGIAVARRVIAELAKRGPYAGLFQLGYFDAPSKIKTSSIVSYGLRPLVKFDGVDSLFSAWKNDKKSRLKDREKRSSKGDGYDDDVELLEEYISFCVKKLSEFLLAAKLSYGTKNWDVDHETPSPLLRPTSINGLIACFRRVIGEGMPLAQEKHQARMGKFPTFPFADYTSSQWDALGERLFDHFYKRGGS